MTPKLGSYTDFSFYLHFLCTFFLTDLDDGLDHGDDDQVNIASFKTIWITVEISLHVFLPYIRFRKCTTLLSSLVFANKLSISNTTETIVVIKISVTLNKWSNVQLQFCVTTELYFWCWVTPSFELCFVRGSGCFLCCLHSFGQTILSDLTNWTKTDNK